MHLIYPFRDNEFDVAVSIGVFEHIRPMSKLVKASMEIARVSRRFLVVVPSIATLGASLSENTLAVEVP